LNLSTNSFGASDILLRLKVFDEPLAELRKGAKRRFSRFPIQYEKGNAAPMPHLWAMQEAAEILKLRSLSLLSENQHDAALEDILLMLRLAEAILPEPYIMSHFTALTILQHALQPFWEGLAARRWSGPHLQSMEARLAQFNLFPAWRRTERGEVLRRIEEWEKLFEPPPAEMSSSEKRAEVMLARLYPRGWAYRNQVALWRAHETEIESWMTPDMRRLPPERVARLFDIDPSEPRGDPRLVVRAISGRLREVARAQANLSMAQTAAILERYHEAKGRYPETLDLLTPEFAAELPPDPMSDGAPKYRLDPERRIVLYSVGLNGKDDSGETVHRGDDWVWSYPKAP
jgi:hypothetical protein